MKKGTGELVGSYRNQPGLYPICTWERNRPWILSSCIVVKGLTIIITTNMQYSPNSKKEMNDDCKVNAIVLTYFYTDKVGLSMGPRLDPSSISMIANFL
jgi:hypothetical protein